jgi:TonB family protein
MKVPSIFISFILSFVLHGVFAGCLIAFYSQKETKSVEYLIVQIEGVIGKSQLEEKKAIDEPKPMPPPPKPKPKPKEPQPVSEAVQEERVEEQISEEPQNVEQIDEAKNDINQEAQRIDEEIRKQKELNRYLAALKKKISLNIGYPREAKKNGYIGVPKVGFSILEDGSVRDVQIIVSSGYEILDQSAIEAVRKSFPFDKPPRVLRNVLVDIYFKKE